MKKTNVFRQQEKDDLKFDDTMNKMIDQIVFDQLDLYSTLSDTDKLYILPLTSLSN